MVNYEKSFYEYIKNKLAKDEKEIIKPFKTVKTEYYEEVKMERRIKVVTTTEEWTGSSKDPVTSKSFVYL
jgi:hypothetical protein|tara:strand:- start:820 stop:1029 length:210 start_codon:yes stop_codon:yes gene_type:complete